MLALLLACADAPDPAKPGPTESTPATDTTGTIPGTDSADSTGGTGNTGNTDDTAPPPPPTPVLQFEGKPPRNLLVISVDTMRRDQIGYFSGLDTTPNLDALLAESVVLYDHRSCGSWTAPSALCVVTGTFPPDEGYWPSNVYQSSGPDPRIPWVPDDLHTMAMDLQAAGFYTGIVTANGVFSDNLGGGILNGFETVTKKLWLQAPTVAAAGTSQVNRALRDGRPWYAHIHFIDPHTPYEAPDAYATELADLGSLPWDVTDSTQAYLAEAAYWSASELQQELIRDSLLAVYRGEFRFWDETFGQLWASLDAVGALDDTLVVFWTDHGEQFAEHTGFHHGISLYDQENRSTAAFWARNLRPTEWMGKTLHYDLAPTILEGLGLPADPEMIGLVAGLAPADRTTFQFNYILGWEDPHITMIRDQKKLMYYWNGRKYFYDLAADPEELTDLYDAEDPEIIDFWSELGPEIDGIAARWPEVVPVSAAP